MNPIFLDLGFISIYWYSIFIAMGLLVGIVVVFKEIRKVKIEENFTVNLILGAVILAIIGARLYYILFNLNYYLKYPIDIFKVWEGGLAIHGGIILGFLWIVFYTTKKKVSTLKMLDILAVGLIIGQAIGRWGNFFNSEAYGGEVTLAFLQNLHIPSFIIDGMYINGSYHHPTFLYESLWNLLGFGILLIIRHFKNLNIGNLFSIYLIWYGIGRFFIEALRTDSLMFMDLRIAQIVSLIMILSGIVLLIITIIKKEEI